jgi:hypothetical protein
MNKKIVLSNMHEIEAYLKELIPKIKKIWQKGKDLEKKLGLINQLPWLQIFTENSVSYQVKLFPVNCSISRYDAGGRITFEAYDKNGNHVFFVYAKHDGLVFPYDHNVIRKIIVNTEE